MQAEGKLQQRPRRRAVVVDCSPLTRLGIVGLINAQEHLTVCGDTHDVTVARQQIAERQPHLVLLDLELERGDGLELIRELPSLSPSSQAIVVSSQESSASLQRAFRTGARGFMSKFDEPRELLAGIELVEKGELFASRRIAGLLLQILASGTMGGEPREMAKLSNRELQVFQLLGRGLGVKAAAGELGLSVRTIETHQLRIKRKLGLKTCGELQTQAAAYHQRQVAGPTTTRGVRQR